MQYSFTCPLEGCKTTLTTEAANIDEGVDKLALRAKAHLQEIHPDVKKTDEEIRSDVALYINTGGPSEASKSNV